MQSKAATVDAYLAELPSDRRAALEAVREVFRKNLDRDFEEGMQYGMIGYYVPHKVFPPGYHCDPKQPLPYAGMASQKNHMSLHLMSLYISGSPDRPGGANEHEQWFRDAWAKTGKKLDMGKACIRFKKIEDLALDVIGEAVRRVPAAKYIERYQATLQATSKKPAAKAAKKPSKPKANSKKQGTKAKK